MLDHDHDDMMAAVDDLMPVEEEEEEEAEEDREEREAVDKIIRWELCRNLLNLIQSSLQGDTSGCAKPPVDTKTKVLFWPFQVRPGQAKTELLFWYKWEVWLNLMCHPVEMTESSFETLLGNKFDILVVWFRVLASSSRRGCVHAT